LKKPVVKAKQPAKVVMTNDFMNAFKNAGAGGGWGAIKIEEEVKQPEPTPAPPKQPPKKESAAPKEKKQVGNEVKVQAEKAKVEKVPSGENTSNPP